ncbi:MAG: hypothetical protein NC489_07900 [Ruminococcus flavefaciens]|nr:hypothetical protein [Ruminococcus flavefaciens]
MNIAGLDDCIYQFMHKRYACSFKRAGDDLIASGDNVEVCIGNDEPFYSKVEICIGDDELEPCAYYGRQTPIADTMQIKHLTLYTEEQLKEILKDE